MEKCPVCGMDVDPQGAYAETEIQGRSYFFCSRECKEEFDRDPQRYVVAA